MLKILAFLLLICPEPVEPALWGWLPGMTTAMHELCHELQLTKYFPTLYNEDESNLGYYQWQYKNARELYWNLLYLPRIQESCNFPHDRDWLRGQMDHARIYILYCQEMTKAYPSQREYWTAFHLALTQRIKLYDSLDDSKGEAYDYEYRRRALMRIKEVLGDDMYYTGRLPGILPLQFFQEIP